MSVKRNQFLSPLHKNNCYLHRNGSNHDIYQNSTTKKKTSVPRHPRIDKNLSNLICKQLEIPKL